MTWEAFFAEYANGIFALSGALISALVTIVASLVLWRINSKNRKKDIYIKEYETAVESLAAYFDTMLSKIRATKQAVSHCNTRLQDIEDAKLKGPNILNMTDAISHLEKITDLFGGYNDKSLLLDHFLQDNFAKSEIEGDGKFDEFYEDFRELSIAYDSAIYFKVDSLKYQNGQYFIDCDSEYVRERLRPALLCLLNSASEYQINIVSGLAEKDRLFKLKFNPEQLGKKNTRYRLFGLSARTPSASSGT